jgi:hypothetical protein
MNKKTTIIIASVIGSLLCIGAAIYLFSEVHTPPPRVKKYECALDYDQLISKINKFCTGRHDVKFEVTDSIVDQNNHYALYALVTRITARDSVEYGLKFERNTSKPNSTIVSMAEGDDPTHRVAGYTIVNMQVKKNAGDFNSNFLIPLQKDQGIKFTPL